MFQPGSWRAAGAAGALAAAALSGVAFAGPPSGGLHGGGGPVGRPGGPRFIGGMSAAQDPAEPRSLRDVLFGSHAEDPHSLRTPPVARYSLEGGDGFVVDRQDRGQTLFKLEDSAEIWALTPTAGPRGDIIFKNDVGEPVLRTTRMGGLTLFTSERPQGVAAALNGAAATAALRNQGSLGPNALYAILGQASVRATRAAAHAVTFDAPEVTPKTDWAFADAAALAGEAFARAAQQGARALIARFFEVKLTPGKAPSVLAEGQVVTIVVAPGRGPSGRPSSQRILMTLVAR